MHGAPRNPRDRHRAPRSDEEIALAVRDRLRERKVDLRIAIEEIDRLRRENAMLRAARKLHWSPNAMNCAKCDGRGLLAHDELGPEARARAGFGSVFPCDACGGAGLVHCRERERARPEGEAACGKS